MTETITLRRPDDMHVHLREGAMLRAVLPYTAGVFARAIIMPNLAAPIVTTAQALAYRQEILASLPKAANFTPLMTLYLTETTEAKDVAFGVQQGVVTALKLYPAHATTNSAYGVNDIGKTYAVLERMQDLAVPLLVHGEVSDPDIDIFDREAVFVERVLPRLRQDFPALKIVLEHVTTIEAVDYVLAEAPKGGLAATITAHHLVINRTDIFQGGLRPDFYCLPVAKRETHRQKLVWAATSGLPWFFLGTDTAPHTRDKKLASCCAAGIFSAPVALPVYATVFAAEQKLAHLEAFASEYGARFYGLPLNDGVVTLVANSEMLNTVPVAETSIAVFQQRQAWPWRVV